MRPISKQEIRCISYLFRLRSHPLASRLDESLGLSALGPHFHRVECLALLLLGLAADLLVLANAIFVEAPSAEGALSHSRRTGVCVRHLGGGGGRSRRRGLFRLKAKKFFALRFCSSVLRAFWIYSHLEICRFWRTGWFDWRGHRWGSSSSRRRTRSRSLRARGCAQSTHWVFQRFYQSQQNNRMEHKKAKECCVALARNWIYVNNDFNWNSLWVLLQQWRLTATFVFNCLFQQCNKHTKKSLNCQLMTRNICFWIVENLVFYCYNNSNKE